MKIVWEIEGNTVFAEAHDVIIDGYWHDHLLIAEINPRLGAYEVRFESAWNDPVHCDTLEDAKNLIIKTHTKYKPNSIGKNYYLK